MSTTSLFVVILIVGLEALIWLGLLVDTGWDLSPCAKILKEWKEYSALITTLLIALAYVFGIFIDRVADSFYNIFRYAKEPPAVPVGKMRLRIMKDSEGMAKFLDYQRSRLRIARATVFNLFVTILVGSIWIVRHYHETESFTVVLVGSLIIGIIAYTFRLVTTGFTMKRTQFICLHRTIFVFSIVFFLGLIPAHQVMADDLFTQETKLVRLEESWSGEFGSSVSMDGDTIAVGATSWKRTEICCSYGAVYVYYRDRGGVGNWGEVKKIAPTDISHPGFGYSVAISGDILVVGFQQSNLASSSSAAYIFYRNQGGTDNWGQVKKITGIGSDSFGYSVAVEGDTIIVGDPSDGDNGSSAGAAYIFQRDFGGLDNWGQVKKISPGDGAKDDSFGGSVAIGGDTVVVGATQSTAYVVKPPGKAYIFERDYGGVDNWGEVKKIVPADGEADDRFGHSVAISGDTVVIVAALDDDNGTDSGSVYIFERDYGGVDNWGEVKKIVPADGEADDRFGHSVAVHGSTLIVGAEWDDDNGSNSGSAYVFYRNQGGNNNWGQITKVLPGDGSIGRVYAFGSTVFIFGDTLVVGSPSSGEKGFMMGMAYIFERDSGGIDNWGQTKRIFPVDSRYVAGDRFGKSVSIDGDTIAAGAYLDDEGGSSSGAVYVFERNLLGTSNWGQYRKRYISATTSNPSDYFGWSVSVSSGTIVTGAYGDDDNGSNAGAAYISERSNEGSDEWGYDTVKKLLPSDGAPSDYFGYAVAISEDTAVVGAYQDDDNGLSSGSAYIFQRDFGGTDNWGQVKKITPDDGAASDYFGYSVSISGDSVAVGSYQDDDNGSNSGSVYVFYRNQGGPDEWGQVTKITPDDGAASDYFGRAVALGLGGALIVGAPGDDDHGSSSGSAYIFERHYGGEDNWGQVNKLTASDGAASDSFGCAVSVDWITAVVGACQDDDRGSNSGSAYLFMRRYSDGTNNWVQEQKLTASDGLASDNFGEAVSINNDTIVIGASSDDDFGSLSGSVYVWFMDTDNDGIRDGIENITCTNSSDADSDDDGISDGSEDANHNGVVDTNETDPCNKDTDGDGIQDGTELGVTTGHATDTGGTFIPDADGGATTTDPLNPDSDGDGLSDGEEDANYNGKVDEGESDPNEVQKRAIPWIPLLLLED